MRDECLRLIGIRMKLPETKVIITKTPEGTKVTNIEDIRAFARNASRIFSRDIQVENVCEANKEPHISAFEVEA